MLFTQLPVAPSAHTQRTEWQPAPDLELRVKATVMCHELLSELVDMACSERSAAGAAAGGDGLSAAKPLQARAAGQVQESKGVVEGSQDVGAQPRLCGACSLM